VSALSPELRGLLRCPACHAELADADAQLRCTGRDCGRRFPVADGVPVLIDEQRSLFRVDEVVRAGPDGGGPPGVGRRLVRALTPSISRNVKGAANFARLAYALREQAAEPRVLVVGGGLLGEGMQALLDDPEIEVLQTDVRLGPRNGLVCDAHDLPFEDGSFDGVVAQAMLEHVLDPGRCVEEIHRVLSPRGLVYAETPFMQQVHEGAHDFTRFTHLGHRRLFRRFEELDSGAVGGPGMALAWAWRHFLWSQTRSRLAGSLLTTLASFTSFFLKWFDGRLVDRPRGLDAAAGVYFLGRRSERTLSDRELIEQYRGAG
jgi:SAM-dependent methyltransferase